MMEVGILSCFLLLLTALVHVDARSKLGSLPMDEGDNFPYVDNLPPKSICDSCLEPSKKAVKSSSTQKLFKELSMLSSEVCHILPSALKVKCLETSDAYVHRTRLLVNGRFNEETLCENTGLCLLKSLLPTDNSPMELTEERTCSECRQSVKDIFRELNHPKMRMKVMDALIEYCEEVEDNEALCKQAVYKYAPMVFEKLEKLKSNELCRMLGFCDEGVSAQNTEIMLAL